MLRASISSAHTLGYQGEQDQTEYIVGAIAHLEAITSRKLDAMQARSWMEKLRKYPKWKVRELGDYSGPMNQKVFEYLDALHPPMQKASEVFEDLGYKRLPGPDYPDIATDVRKYIESLPQLYEFPRPLGTPRPFHIDGTWNEKYDDYINNRRLELYRTQKKGLEALHAKYPALGFDELLRDKKYRDI